MIARKDTAAAVLDNLSVDVEHPAIALMETSFRYGLVPYLEGQPGVAKSSLVYQLAAKMDEELIEFRPALEDLSGIKGLPHFVEANDGKTIVGWAIPKHFPREEDWEGIFFIDEVVQASPSMQGALSQLVLDRKIGDYTLPKGAKLVLAGNRVKDRAAVNKMPTHIANRMAIIQVEFELDAWKAWAKREGLPGVSIAFADFRPGLLDSFDPKQQINCTPRSYAFAAPLLNEPKAIAFPLVQGLIGEGPAAELFGFKEAWLSVPSREAVVKKGKTLDIPEQEHLLYATISKLAFEVTPDDFDPIMEYITRFPVESQTAFIKMALSQNSEVAVCDTFDIWIMKNREYLV